MSFLELATAIGLLAPLVLGVLAFIEKWHSRKKEDKPEEPVGPVVKGMAVGVDFAAQLVAELQKDVMQAEVRAAAAEQRERELRAKLEAYRQLDNK